MIRHTLFSLVLLTLWAMLFSTAHANEPSKYPPQANVTSPGVELWNAVRQRNTNTEASDSVNRSQVKSTESNVLINVEGENWRHFRMQTLIPSAAKLLLFTLAVILLFRLIRGRIPIHAGRSTQRIRRFSRLQQWVHWITAILFVGLAFSGIALLFGRYIIMPYLGAEAGGSIMYALKRWHDLSGPVFGVSLLVMIIVFMKGNFLSFKTDVMWLLRAGGMLGGGHPHAGRYNAGEKLWYWAAAVIGLVVVASGLVLNFPIFDQTRLLMMDSHFLHSITAVVIMAASLGHIYMGTIAIEGAYECMATGYCDVNWAKEHHDLWHDEMLEADKLENNP